MTASHPKSTSRLGFQLDFLGRLSKKFTDRAEFIREVGRQLNVGRDAVYRRLRGETVLGADEMMVLSKAFKVSIVTEDTRSDLPTMAYPNVMAQTRSEIDFFTRLGKYTSSIASLRNVRVDYATSELPTFYFFAWPTLRAFKIYAYSLSCWNFPKWRGRPFQRDLVSPQTHAILDRIVDDSQHVAGRELWGVGILDTTLRQIAYMVETGQFASNDELKELFREIRELINFLEKMIRSGKRCALANRSAECCADIQVYHNELSNSNNLILIRSEEQNMLLSSLIIPNYMVTTDARLIKDAEDWIGSLVDQSNSLNATAGKYVTRYFAQLRQKVDSMQERINFNQLSF